MRHDDTLTASAQTGAQLRVESTRSAQTGARLRVRRPASTTPGLADRAISRPDFARSRSTIALAEASPPAWPERSCLARARSAISPVGRARPAARGSLAISRPA